MAEKELLGVWEFPKALDELSDEQIDALAGEMYDVLAARLTERQLDD